jgi:hypothetical protein
LRHFVAKLERAYGRFLPIVAAQRRDAFDSRTRAGFARWLSDAGSATIEHGAELAADRLHAESAFDPRSDQALSVDLGEARRRRCLSELDLVLCCCFFIFYPLYLFIQILLF